MVGGAGNCTDKHDRTNKGQQLWPEVAVLIFGFTRPEHAVKILLSILRVVRLCGAREHIFRLVSEQVEL